MNSTNSGQILEELIALLPGIPEAHSPKTPLHGFLNRVALAEAERDFSSQETALSCKGLLKDLKFPFHQMGAITSVHLFGVDELIIFSFYWTNRKRYKKVLDLGANIGLHSIMMSRCGYDVRAYEPDPKTYEVLKRNLKLNGCSGVEAINAAVSTSTGEMEFVRVLGNMTGSHLAAAKAAPYGELEKFSVKVEEFKPLLRWADLCKIDVEGHEKEILLTTTAEDWSKTDALLEVGSEENARAIFAHFAKMPKIALFAQKNSWKQIRTLDDMPTSYRDGSLFITAKSAVPWSGELSVENC